MKLLSFDTSSSSIQIACLENAEILASLSQEPQFEGRQEAASMLIPLIDRQIKEAGWKKHDIDLLVVGAGPGSFTGVRVAVAAARSICQALNLGLIPSSRLESLSFLSERPLALLLAAGGGKYFGAAYDLDMSREGGGLLVEPFCDSYEASMARLGQAHLPNLLLDNAGQNLPDAGATFANDKRLLQFPQQANLALAQAQLAWQRISRLSEFENIRREELRKIYPWDNVLPLYLRSPSVTLKPNASSSKTN